MSDHDDMMADAIATREPMLCSCGEPCDHSHGLCPACEAWAETVVVTIAAAVSFALCERKWSQAAQSEQDDFDAELRELLKSHGRQS